MGKYGLYNNRNYSLRLPEELKMKFEIIAREKGYKMISRAYKDLIEEYVNKYEAENGRIEL